MESQKTILVLPGSNWQIELVKKVRQMGHKVLVVNPYENSPCFPYADGYLQSDIFDFEKVVAYCRENEVEAIVSDECDIAMPLVARLGEELELPTLDSESARLFTDKFQMREFCREHGLKYPKYRLCKNAEEAIDLLHEISAPIIIKPLDSNSSRGVFKVKCENEILECFEEALAFSRSKKCVLAERYIEGTEFTIDGVKTPTTHYTLAISEKKHFEHNVNIASELLFSHYNDRFDYDELRKINDAFVMNSTLRYGFTHAEYKCENGEYYLIEIAARGGGNMISSIITQFMSGHDTYHYLIEGALGNISEVDFSIPEEYKDRVAVLKFFETPKGGGLVKKIHGLDVLDGESDIVKYMFNFAIGDTIENAVSDAARIGFYIVCSDSMEKLQTVIDKVENSFRIELEA